MQIPILIFVTKTADDCILQKLCVQKTMKQPLQMKQHLQQTRMIGLILAPLVAKIKETLLLLDN